MKNSDSYHSTPLWISPLKLILNPCYQSPLLHVNFTKLQLKPVTEHSAFTRLGPPVCNNWSQHQSVRACSVYPEHGYHLFSEKKQFAHTSRYLWTNESLQALPDDSFELFHKVEARWFGINLENWLLIFIIFFHWKMRIYQTATEVESDQDYGTGTDICKSGSSFTAFNKLKYITHTPIK